MNRRKSFSDLVYLEVTSADVAGFLERMTQQGIPAFQVTQIDDLTMTLCIYNQHLSMVVTLCERGGDRLRILKSSTFRKFCSRVVRRPVLILGVAMILLLTMYLPTRIFFVQVKGHETVPARVILEAARESGISFGASRKAVRSEKVKNRLLEAVPQLKWAGVNTVGCVAIISVRERELEESENPGPELCNIVAIRDGIITACTATRGTLLCAPGQAVTRGQILISGYTDCGIALRAEAAQGEIYGETRHQFTAVMPLKAGIKDKEGLQLKKISLLVGKKRINLWKDSGIWDTICDRMYEEYYVTLPGGFRLPAALAVEIYDVYTAAETADTEDATVQQAEDLCRGYLLRQIIAGRLISQQVSVQEEEGCIRLTGEYLCVELIGKMQRLEIGENYGQDN